MPGLENGAGPRPEAEPIAEDIKEDLAGKIQGDFDKAMGNTDEDDSTPEPEAREADSSAETEPEAKETDGEQDDAETTETAVEKKEPSAPTFPAAYRRTLKALEWTDEEINDAARRPELLTSIAKLHASRNKEVGEWAAAGRRAKEQAAQQKPAPQAAPAVTAMKPVDVAALKAKYGDEGLIDELVGPINETIRQLNSMMPEVQKVQQRAAMSQLEVLSRQVDGFFGDKELKSYKELYGVNGKLTPTQEGARQKVVEYADYLVGGASQNGRSLNLNEALTMAHDAVSGSTKTQAAREEIKGKMVERQKGISLKPGSRGTNLKSPTKASNKQALEKRVSGGLRAMFG
jgi:hypothetical protein